MKSPQRSPNLKKNNFTKEIISCTSAIVVIYAIGKIFNILADYRGITLLPGIRKSFHYILNNLVDNNPLFLQNNSLDLQLGLGSVEIVLCVVWFLQIKLLFQSIFFKSKNRKIKKQIKKQSIDTIKLIALTTAVNFIPIFLLHNIIN